MKKCLFCKFRVQKLENCADSRKFCAEMRPCVRAFYKLCLVVTLTPCKINQFVKILYSSVFCCEIHFDTEHTWILPPKTEYREIGEPLAGVPSIRRSPL